MPLPVTDALLHLVLNELRTRDARGDDVIIAGRLGLPHARVLHVLHVAADRGLVQAVPLYRPTRNGQNVPVERTPIQASSECRAQPSEENLVGAEPGTVEEKEQ